MNSEKHDRQGDIVDEAVRTLLEAPLPPGPSDEALARTLTAVRQADSMPARPTLMERIQSMNRWTKVGTAAAMVVAAAVCGFLLFGGGGGIAFAEVKERIQAAETFTCKVVISAPGLKQPMVFKAYFKEPGRVRAEAAFGVISITDVQKGKVIMLNPKAKEATVINLADLPQIEQQQMSFLTELKELIEGKPQDLGEEKIDGTAARHYRIPPEKQAAGVSVVDLWADVKTGDPIRVELEGRGHEYKITMTDFRLNPRLDDKLFSVEVPKGYSPINIGRPSLKDVLDGLRFMAVHNGGTFPESLAMNIELYKKLSGKVPKAELKEKWLMLGRMHLFIEAQVQAQQWSQWKYVGAGVKLGDRTRPVMHWLPKGAARHKVLYGDLKRTEDVDASKLPSRATTKAAA
jgi:outer membrane lipoprotein-sorting protein